MLVAVEFRVLCEKYVGLLTNEIIYIAERPRLLSDRFGVPLLSLTFKHICLFDTTQSLRLRVGIIVSSVGSVFSE